MNMASEVYEMNLEDENTKLKAEIDELLEYTGCKRQDDCWVSSFISRVCAKGTKGCIAKHKGE